MTNVKFSRKEFEKHISLTKENIEKISLFGTPLEGINGDDVEVEIFPNRPDLISLQGYLRSFKAFLGKEVGLKTYKINKPKDNFSVEVSSSLKNIRPFTACAIITDINFDDKKIKEIIDLQEKLHLTVGRNRSKVAIGVYPLEKIKLPIKFEAMSPEKIRFVPLESKTEMSGSQILKNHPTGKEFAHLLEDFKEYPVFVDSDNKILSMPPIINSNDTGKVNEDTKEIFIECSGKDLELLKKTLNIIVTTLAEMGGKIYQIEIIYKNAKIITPDLTPEKMSISLENTNKLLGLNIKETQLPKLLEKMGFDYKNKKVLIPAWRTDILHEVDLIEDVAIAYGYDKFEPQIPNVSTIGEESRENALKRKISEMLIGLKNSEISTYHLIKERDAEIMNCENIIEVEKSKTEYKILRPSLLIPALRTLAENKDNEYPQNIFEIGTVFLLEKESETSVKENENLLIANSPGNLTNMMQTMDYLLSNLNVNYKLKEAPIKKLIDGRSAKIICEDSAIGYIGELHPETLRDFGINMPVAVAEITLNDLCKNKL